MDPVLFVTGASTGIGEAIARLAAASGWRVVLAARSVGPLEALAEDLGPERALAVACDVADWASQAAAVERGVEAFGRLDAAVANAGGAWGPPLHGGEDDPEAWRRMILTNVFGVAATIRLTVPHLLETRGHVVLMGSVVGRFVPAGSLYAPTKWAVTAMAESLRQQMGGRVRVTLVGPGRVDTPFWSQRPADSMLEPEDVARAVLYALSQPPHVDVSEVLVRPVGQKL
jgi:NADP-dependent 3-hydroxy acid dehydrogenase YdfG